MIKNEKRKDPEGSRLDRPVKGGLQPTKGTRHTTALTVVLPAEDVALGGDAGDEHEAHRADRVVFHPITSASNPALFLLRDSLPSDGVLVLDCRGQSHVGGTIFGGQGGGNVQFHGFVPLGCAQSAKALRAGFVDSDTKIMYK